MTLSLGLFSIFWLKKELIWDVFNKYPFLGLPLDGPYSVPSFGASSCFGDTTVSLHLVLAYTLGGRLLALLELLQ